MKTEVEAAFTEMLDISKDIDKAVLFAPGEVLASNFAPGAEAAAVAQAEELVALGEERACDMGSQPLTQLVVETPCGVRLSGSGDGPGGHDDPGDGQEEQPGRPRALRSEDLSA